MWVYHLNCLFITDILLVNTNQGKLELYAVIGEHDNQGFPLAYCLVSTATTVADSKRKLALASFLSNLCDTYQLCPHFIHTDKDIAEIHAAQTTWPESKHQLCWWHLHKALCERLAKSKLSTTAYNATQAHAEFLFIDTRFTPSSRPDRGEDEAAESTGPHPWAKCTMSNPLAPGPNSIPIKIPITASFKASHPPLLKNTNATVVGLC